MQMRSSLKKSEILSEVKRADVLLFLLHQVRDLLYSCYDAAANGGDFEKVLEEIKSRYYEIIKGLGLALSMEEDFQLIKENFKAQIGRDYAASRGEYLNGKEDRQTSEQASFQM